MITKKNKLPSRSEPRRILVPVDFSVCSQQAVATAVMFANRHEAHLVLLHVIEPFHAAMFMDASETQRAARAVAHERLTKLADATKKVWPRTGRELRSGHPVETIIALAKRTKADLIVMGTHGRTGIKRAFIGSVAERVVRHAECSVMVVR